MYWVTRQNCWRIALSIPSSRIHVLYSDKQLVTMLDFQFLQAGFYANPGLAYLINVFHFQFLQAGFMKKTKNL